MVSKQPLGCSNQIIETNLSFKIELSVPFTNITFDIHEGLPLSFWCFVRFTLFNLQGTRREERRFFKSTTTRPVCQVLFSFLSELFRTLIRSGRRRRTHLYYHFFFTLSRTFFTDSATFVARVFVPGSVSRSSLHTIPLLKPIVNPIFSIFSTFFIPPFPLAFLTFSL